METVRNSDPFRMGAARRLRKHLTEGERTLWNCLRKKQIGYRVRRQYTCGSYVLDFYIHAARLCIEVDGPTHDPAHDRERDLELGEKGILTLRIPASDLPGRIDRWLKEIAEICEARVALFSRTPRGY